MKTFFVFLALSSSFLFGFSTVNTDSAPDLVEYSDVFEFPEYQTAMGSLACDCSVACFGVHCCKTCPSNEECSCACNGFRNCSCSACEEPDEQMKMIDKAYKVKSTSSYALSEEGYMDLKNFATFLHELQEEKTMEIALGIADAVETLSTQDFALYETQSSEFYSQLSALSADLKFKVNNYLKEAGAPEAYMI